MSGTLAGRGRAPFDSDACIRVYDVLNRVCGYAAKGSVVPTPDRKSVFDGFHSNPFTKAVKYAAKGRVALVGPAGSGNSYTSLLLARALAGPHGKIAAIDTEHGSLSKYADLFDFEVIELDSFSPKTFIDSLHAAEDAGYNVFLTDSLSHFWVGRDGALEFVDMAQERNKDQQGGWKEFRPHERLMVDEMISSPCHIICTMRTKTDYQNQMVDGRSKRVKVGLAPVQRDGLEYEFDLVGYMDEENNFIVDKTRCSEYSQKAYAKPGPKVFEPFVNWLKGSARVDRPKSPVEPVIDTGGHPLNTAAAAQHVAQQKLAAGSAASQATWRTMGECERAFAAKREAVDEVVWREVLEKYGWTGFPDIKRAYDAKRPNVKEAIAECYSHLDAIARKAVA
jgi:AAA domain